MQNHGVGGRPRPVLETRGGAQRFSGSEGRAAGRCQAAAAQLLPLAQRLRRLRASPLLYLERGTLTFTMCAMCRMPEDGAGAALMPAIRTAECAQPSAPLLSTHAGSHV